MKYDVIIIGAGIAGLKAAKTLAEAGFTVLILEAKNRIGGRIQTATTASGFLIELGASMITAFEPDSLSELNPLPNPLLTHLQRLNLKTVPVDPNQAVIFDAGHKPKSTQSNTATPGSSAQSQSVKPQTLAAIKEALTGYFDGANMMMQEAKTLLKDTSQDKSLADVLLYPYDASVMVNPKAFLAKQTLTAMIEHHLGAGLNKISVQEFLEPNVSSNDNPLLVLGGLQRLTEDLLQSAQATKLVSLRLNSPVAAVRYQAKEGVVKVVTQNGKEYIADTVLCTVPLGVVKRKAIHFSPALSPEKQKAIQHLGVGQHNKVYLEFEKPFWESDAHFIFPGSADIDEWPEYMNLFALSKQKAPVLVANFYAKEAEFKDKPDSSCVKKALQPLQRVYGKKMSALKHATVTRWDNDAFTLGSTSFCGLQYHPADVAHLEEPEGMQDRKYLYFAGEYTDQNRSTILGAYRSGMRAALDIEAERKFRLDRPEF